MRDIPRVIEAKGATIPIVGLGTWPLSGRDCVRLVEAAIATGYRHVDTAQMYANEAEVGEAIRNSGLRDQIFLTTKVSHANQRAGVLEQSVRDSLARMKLPFADLIILHWPNEQIPLVETIKALNNVKREGLARHIGVSNFTTSLLDQALKLTEEPLVCDQFEYHPFLDQTKLVAACRKHGLAVVAYSPVARGQAGGSEALAKIGRAHGKSAAQVSLRWLVQQGIVVIPRTSKVERLKENIDIFDFELSGTEMADIAAMSRARKRIVNLSHAPAWD